MKSPSNHTAKGHLSYFAHNFPPRLALYSLSAAAIYALKYPTIFTSLRAFGTSIYHSKYTLPTSWQELKAIASLSNYSFPISLEKLGKAIYPLKNYSLPTSLKAFREATYHSRHSIGFGAIVASGESLSAFIRRSKQNKSNSYNQEKVTESKQTPNYSVASSNALPPINRYPSIQSQPWNTLSISIETKEQGVNASLFPKHLFVAEACDKLAKLLTQQNAQKANVWEKWTKSVPRNSFYDEIPDYIATQWPTKESIPHFWSMVWEYNVSQIICLAPLNGKEELDQYWPHLQSKTYGSLNIDIQENKEYNDIVVTDLTLSNDNNQKRTIHHCHYTAWSDIDEIDATKIKSIFKKSNYYTPKGSVVVHCSDGVGRTGIFLGCMMGYNYSTNDINNVLSVLQFLRSESLNMNAKQQALINRFLTEGSTE